MRYRKNEIIEIDIDDLGNEGEGIGHLDGYTLFIKGALPGERVRAGIMKAGKSYGYARLLEVIKKSDERIEPLCPAAGKCGGCALQHLSYREQLRFKQKKVIDCLERIGGVNCEEAEVFPIIGMETPWHYRNKAQFPVRAGKDGKAEAGIYAGRTHSVIPVTDCMIQDEVTKQVLERFLEFMERGKVSAYDERSHTGKVRHVFIRKGFMTGEVMVCLVVNEPAERFRKSYGKRMTESFGKVDGIVSIQVNENQEKTNVIMGRKYLTVWGKEHIEDIIGNMRYLISGESFYQVNAEQTVILYKKVLEFAGLKEGGCVWDLYCGIGTISLFLAAAVGESGEVVGVEIVRKAIEDAKRNAALNGIKNVRFICGAAEDIGKTRRADVVVVDPPRKGCDEEVLKVIGEVKAQKVVYVSCNPGTLGRDVKILGEMGYDVKKVQGVDMFPWTGHVEIVVLLTTANR